MLQLKAGIMKKQVENVKKDLSYMQDAEVIKNEIAGYKTALNYVKEAHVPPQWTIKFVSSLMPENMVLDTLIFNNKDRFLTLSGFIHVRSGSPESVITEFTKKLKQVELFKNTQLVSVEIYSNSVYRFNVLCELAQ